MSYTSFMESLRGWEDRARAALVIELALRGLPHGTVSVFPALFVEDGAWVRYHDTRVGRDNAHFISVATMSAITREQLTLADMWLHTSSEPPPPHEQRPAWAEWWP